ncbi:hypothetical protein Pan97_21800 [Bremerella volcania]|uniref:Uncharacterized protein n=1 Tax=Bremerella volcania TaxID=2527984 RepID=A0A518C7E9_9BACT|nr:hypothetical protein Pan97_21800 [Bremerella volcania]
MRLAHDATEHTEVTEGRKLGAPAGRASRGTHVQSILSVFILVIRGSNSFLPPSVSSVVNPSPARRKALKTQAGPGEDAGADGAVGDVEHGWEAVAPEVVAGRTVLPAVPFDRGNGG